MDPSTRCKIRGIRSVEVVILEGSSWLKQVTLATARMGIRPFFFSSLAQLFEKGDFCWPK